MSVPERVQGAPPYEEPALGSERAEKLLNIPRRLLFPLDQDLTVRLFGGFSLLVLAQ